MARAGRASSCCRPERREGSAQRGIRLLTVSTRLRRLDFVVTLNIVVTLSAAKGLCSGASDICGVIGTPPCSARLPPSGPLSFERKLAKETSPDVAPAARVRGRLRGAPITIPGVRRASASLALALRADPSGVRRAEGGEKPKAKAQRPPSGAEDQEIGIGTIHPWDGISGPALHGRAFADCARAPLAAVRRRPKGPQEGREGSRPCRAGAGMHRRGTGRRRTHPPGQRLKGAARGSPFFGSFLWRRLRRRSGANRTAGPAGAEGRMPGVKKGTCSAAAERNQTVCRGRSRSQTLRCADPSLCSG